VTDSPTARFCLQPTVVENVQYTGTKGFRFLNRARRCRASFWAKGRASRRASPGRTPGMVRHAERLPRPARGAHRGLGFGQIRRFSSNLAYRGLGNPSKSASRASLGAWGGTRHAHVSPRAVGGASPFDRSSKSFLSRSSTVSGEFGQFGQKWLDFHGFEAWVQIN
jgi:hypothetical protein